MSLTWPTPPGGSECTMPEYYSGCNDRFLAWMGPLPGISFFESEFLFAS